jgi:hypothetical protein
MSDGAREVPTCEIGPGRSGQALALPLKGRRRFPARHTGYRHLKSLDF